jgi:hypothetical protein
MLSSCSYPHQPPSIPFLFHHSYTSSDLPKSGQHDDSTPPQPLFYSMTAQLKILQYNVHTTKGLVMAPLLADPQASEFSVLAVQEPWQNPHILTTHNLSTLSFHIFYPPFADASVCFFVNKSLNPSSYSACFPTPKYGHLRIRSPVEGVRDIMIHNVYRTRNLPPTSSVNKPRDEPLSLDTHEIFSFVSAALSDAIAHHVLLGDFNIHYPSWGGPRVRPHRASHLLLSLQELHNLSLQLPPETITYKKHGGESTIYLVFSSSDLSNTLTACRLRENLDHGSDHNPIETSFLISPHVSPHVPRPC